MIKTFFHTQESREKRLTNPIPCIRDDAWLGEAIYFWFELLDSEHWGHTSKKGRGYFEIYTADINCENVLDTVFNEEHYYFWQRQIEKVAKLIISKTKLKPTIKELNDYFKERGTWSTLDGIQFQDLPTNPNHLLIRQIDYKSKKITFAYRKRIQIAIYNPNIITNFTFFKRERCINF